MKPYAELLEFNQPNPIRVEGFTRIRDQFPELKQEVYRSDLKPTRMVTSVHYDPERIMEFAGRWDYGENSAAKLGQEAKAGGNIITRWIAAGEQSMIEMGHATVFFECSRVVTHELVRHRLASYQQESQRFTLQVLDPDGAFYMPQGLDKTVENVLRSSYAKAATDYEALIVMGVPKQIARYVLPNAARTRIIVSADTREWRHIFKLRLHTGVQPEMREMMQMAYDQMLPVFPQSLEGITEEGRGIR